MRPRWIGLGLVLGVLAVAAVVLLVRPNWYLRARYPLRYPQTVLAHSHTYSLPPTLVAAVIEQESKFDPNAHSSAGAVGLMQLTPDTAEGIALRTGGNRFQESDLLNPEINIRYGCWYLRHLHQKYAKYDEGYILVLAAYNAGQGKVDAWLQTRGNGTHLAVKDIPFPETRAYVERVLALQGDYRKAYPILS